MSDAQILAHSTVESPGETIPAPLKKSPPPFEKNSLNFVYLSNDMISLRLAYPKSYLTPTVNMHRTPYAELETKKQTMHTSFCLPDPSEVSTQIKSH